jgi:DNA-binding MarR family transcriptional regulator
MKDRDYVDHMLAQWAVERPDLDLSPLEVIGRISRISRRFDSQIARTFREFGLSTWGFYVLAALNRAGPPYRLKPTELYRSLLVSSGLMTTRITRLEEEGLVERVPDPADGRSVLVALTPAGKRVVGALLEEHNRREAAMLAPLTRRERQVVASSLRKLLLASGDLAPPSERVQHAR